MDIILNVNDYSLPRLLEQQLRSLLGSFPAWLADGILAAPWWKVV
jgi:hypothetical protein